MIAITGMHRSGTSCIVGLLGQCGYSYGQAQELLNGNEPQLDNKREHFENYKAVLINDMLLHYSGGSWLNPPSQADILKNGTLFEALFNDFSHKFQGHIVKDPRICLTAELWEKYCPSLEAIVLCLRNPLGVAESLKTRNKFSIDHGLGLWCEYNARLLQSIRRIPLVVVDYDRLKDDTEREVHACLQALGSPLSFIEMETRIKGFYERDLNHYPSSKEDFLALPEVVKRLYTILKSKANSKEGVLCS